jgi:Acetylaranotin biosynthesis cluster protein L
VAVDPLLLPRVRPPLALPPHATSINAQNSDNAMVRETPDMPDMFSSLKFPQGISNPERVCTRIVDAVTESSLSARQLVELCHSEARMKYEHLIQVNDPNDSTIMPLTRDQLWQGLVIRVENPEEFVYGLDSMRVRARGGDFVERELYFGARVIKDRVTFVEYEVVRYNIEPSTEFPASQLVMCIEEPQPQHLFLRCSYETVTVDGAEYEEFIKQAYFEADLDTVSRIRALAASGMLG